MGVIIFGKADRWTKSLMDSVSRNITPNCYLFSSSVTPLILLDDTIFAFDAEVVPIEDYSSWTLHIMPATQFKVIFFNISNHKMTSDKIIALPKIFGVFEKGVSEAEILQGIKAIFQGEYWIPRDILNSHLEKTRTIYAEPVHRGVSADLSDLEKLMLLLLTKGYTNRMIADVLSVNLSTVKSKISYIYKKIFVHNRIQAANWLSENNLLPHSSLR